MHEQMLYVYQFKNTETHRTSVGPWPSFPRAGWKLLGVVDIVSPPPTEEEVKFSESVKLSEGVHDMLAWLYGQANNDKLPAGARALANTLADVCLMFEQKIDAEYGLSD